MEGIHRVAISCTSVTEVVVERAKKIVTSFLTSALYQTIAAPSRCECQIVGFGKVAEIA